MGLVNSQANELSGSPVGTWRWGSCSRELAETPALPHLRLRSGSPRRVTALGQCPFPAAPAAGPARRDALPLRVAWTPGRQKGVPARLRPVGARGWWRQGVPSGRACRCTLIRPLGSCQEARPAQDGGSSLSSLQPWPGGRSQAFVKRETSTPFSMGSGDGYTRSGQSHPFCLVIAYQRTRIL